MGTSMLGTAPDGSRPAYNQVRLMQWKQSSVDVDERTIDGWASTGEIDSYEEIIKPTAFSEWLPRYMANPVMYWNHSWWSIPIAKCIRSEVVPDTGLHVGVKFGTTALAEEVWTATAIDNIVRSMSVGFRGDYSPEYGYFDREKDVWVWTMVKLLEISVVGMPANAASQFQLSRSLGLPTTRAYRALSYDVDPADKIWDVHAAEERLRKYVQTGGKDPSCYVADVPIVDAENGRVRLGWAGVACAMARLLGGRGGTGSSQEKDQVDFGILSEAYKRFKKPIPTWKGEWPNGLRDVTFHAGELDFLEDSVLQDNARTMLQAAQSLANGARHLAKGGRGLSADVRDNAERTISTLRDGLNADRGRAQTVVPETRSDIIIVR